MRALRKRVLGLDVTVDDSGGAGSAMAATTLIAISTASL
jgi:hypothetical protein